MHRVLSWKRLLVVVGVLVVLGGAAVAIHAVQVRRQASGLYDQAKRAEGEGDPEKAIELLDQYLKFRPADEGAAVWYLELTFAQAKADPKHAGRAVDAGERVLRTFRDHPDLRRKLVQAYVLLARDRERATVVNNARQHLDMLFQATRGETDVELLELAAEVEELGGDPGKAATYLQQAIDSGKAPVAVYGKLIELYWAHRRDVLGADRKAEALVRVLVEDPKFAASVEALNVASHYRSLTGDEASARTLNQKAQALPGGATDPKVLLTAVEIEMTGITPANRAERLRKAQELAERVVALDPKNVPAALLLSHILFVQEDGLNGKRAAAIGVLVQAVRHTDKVTDGYMLILDRLIDYGDDATVPGMIERVAKEVTRKPLLNYFRGRLALLSAEKAKSDPALWTEARTLLEEAAPFLERLPELHKKAKAGVGRCYEVAQNPDRQFDAYSAALKDDPKYPPALVGKADALVQLGRYPEALPELKTIVFGYGLYDYRPRLARVELLALRGASGGRNWADYDRALGLPDKLPDSPLDWVALAKTLTPELQLMFAESLVVRAVEADYQRKPERAAALRKAASGVLEQLTEQEPALAQVWLALGLLRAAGNPDAVLATLDTGAAKAAGRAKAAGKPLAPAVDVEFRLLRASVQAGRPGKPNPADLRKVTEGAEQFPTPDRHKLWAGLGRVAYQASAEIADAQAAALMRNFALECFRNAADLDPLDLLSRVTLIDLGMVTGRKDVVDAALDQIARVEGPGGPITSLGQVAVRLPQVAALPDATDADKAARRSAVLELRALASRAREARPGWGRVYVMLGQLDELSGEYNAAADNYRKAIDIGDRQEYVVRRLTDIYLQKLDPPKEDEALKVLNLVAPDVKLPPHLEQFRVVKNLLAQEIPESARPEIDRIAPADSDNERVQMLRGSLLAAIGQYADAEAAFRKALAKNDQIPETWTALVVHLVRTERPQAAEDVLKQAEQAIAQKAPREPAERARLIGGLAQCYELIGNKAAAEAKYRAAVAAAPEVLDPNRDLVLYLQRTGRKADADQLLDALGGRRPELARWARRHRALSMMSGADAYRDLPRALALVRENLRETQNDKQDDDDVKAEAVLLTVDPATRADGEKTLEDRYAKWDKLTPDEYYWLAQLRFNRGDVFGSVEYFEKAARPKPGVNHEHMAALVRVYIAVSKMRDAPQPLDHAERALRRLEMSYPKSWEAAREKARVRHQRAVIERKAGRPDRADPLDAEARDAILKHALAKTEPYVRFRSGPLLDELGFYPEAEALFRELLRTGKEEAPHHPLAGFLIARKRTDEALKLAWEYEPKCHPVVTARILTGAVRVQRNPSEEQKIVSWLDDKIAANAGNKQIAAMLIGSKAELYDAQREYDKAIAEYDRAIALNPDRGEVLTNNLCMILVLHRRGAADNAIARMERIIQLRGPVPQYLDTLALAYLVRGGKLPTGEFAAAVAARKMELALAQRETGVYLFHLAWAYDLLDDKRVLKEEKLLRAKELGLTPADLHPLEADKFNELYRVK